MRSDSRRVNDEDIKEGLEYYHDMKDYFVENGQLDFSNSFFPSYKIVKKIDLPEIHCFYDIFIVNDETSLNYFLSCSGGDNDVSIFSKDYGIDFLSNIWSKFQNCKLTLDDDEYIKFYEYLAWEHADYIKTKEFALLDTYSDDEDSDNYLLISDNRTPDITVLNKAITKKDWFNELSRVLKRGRLEQIKID